MLIQVTMKDMPSSQALENHIKLKAQKLSLFTDKITSCKVIVEVPQKHKRQGKIFGVHVELVVPGKQLAATHKQSEDVYVAIRDAFHAAERQLIKYLERRSGYVKHHETSAMNFQEN